MNSAVTLAFQKKKTRYHRRARRRGDLEVLCGIVGAGVDLGEVQKGTLCTPSVSRILITGNCEKKGSNRGLNDPTKELKSAFLGGSLVLSVGSQGIPETMEKNPCLRNLSHTRRIPK